MTIKRKRPPIEICTLLAAGMISVAWPQAACAQSDDPYINAIDDRPAGRLRQDRETDARRAAGLTPDMVRIEPGRFLMGSPAGEDRRDKNEGPQVEVAIVQPFEIGRYEVTFDDWKACRNDGGCKGYKPADQGWGRGQRPVTNISYSDAQSYIKWLNAKTGLAYRLPTEAEWEYVARAGRDLPFSTRSGLSIDARQANFNGGFPYGPGASSGAYHRKTMPVGSYPANLFGVHDIHGNVYEWVSDCYAKSHAGRPATAEARKDGDCKRRVLRGGSWVTHGYQMRAAKRLSYTMDYRYDDFGLRLARTLN